MEFAPRHTTRNPIAGAGKTSGRRTGAGTGIPSKSKRNASTGKSGRYQLIAGELWSIVKGKPPWPKGYEIQPHSGGWAYLWRVPKSKPKERIYAGHLSGRTWEEIKSEPVEFRCEVVGSIIGDERRSGLKAA